VIRPIACLIPVLLLIACPAPDDGDPGPIAREDAARTYAEFWCEMQQTCTCDLAPLEQCIDEYQAQLTEQFDAAEAAGATYHPECLAASIAVWVAIGCQSPSEFQASGAPASEGSIVCKTFSGTGAEGQACTIYTDSGFDSCDKELYCIGGMCRSLPSASAKPLGESCDPQVDACVSGSICSNSAADPETFTCVDRPGVGESCSDVPLCEVGSWCDSTSMTCAEPVGEGEACSSFGMCRPGLSCDMATSTCVTEPPYVCLLGAQLGG
jgi:hypothetical protein